MFSSRLFWKVISYFALLLVILSGMTAVMIFFLHSIQGSYSQAGFDVYTIQENIELKNKLSYIQVAANDYLFTGSLEQKSLYEALAKDIDASIETLQKKSTDSTNIAAYREIRTLLYGWLMNVGEKKIKLYGSNLAKDKMLEEIQRINIQDANEKYLDRAQRYLDSMYDKKLSAVPKSIEFGVEGAKKLNQFIIIVNILLAFFAVILGLVLSRSIINPVKKLRAGTEGIMKSDFQQIVLKQRDELGMLASDFNRMSEMLRNNYNRLTAYSELMTALNKHESTENIEKTSLQILCTHTKSSVGALYLLDTNTNILKLVSGYALKEDSKKVEYAVGEGIPGQCAEMKTTLEVNNIEISKDFILDTGLVSIAPNYILATPILFQNNLIGVIVLGALNPFDAMQREIINNSVPQIGVAITNAIGQDETRRLSREIASKNSELNNKNAELQKAYRVKSEFLSNMSHELRTPLNSIIGFTSVLLGPHGEPLTPDQSRALEKVLKNGKHLLELINDILDFSKIEAGRTPINIDTDEVSNIISNALVTVEPMVTSKGVKLLQDVEPGLPKFNTDILKVKQILLNLLSNAAKFTDEGAITITARKQGDMVAISVKDDGIGIEAKNLDKVFEEFSQIDSSNSRKYKGTGLGLPIARNYARLLGGNLTVQSEFGKGSTFTLVIPPEFPKDKLPKEVDDFSDTRVAAAMATEKNKENANVVTTVKSIAVPEQSVSQTSSILVLCIDDDSEVIDLLRHYLIPEGYSVRGVSDGSEGIRLAKELKPAVITLDIMMPEKDGWQVLRELKSNEETKDIPVIIHSIIENRPLALSLGALDVIAKPSEPKKVLSVVERACRSKNKQIMVVDDNEDFADTLKIYLEHEGYKVAVCNSGEQALMEIEKINPSLLFLDLIMPGIDGFSVAKRLRSKEKWQELPIVILSGADISNSQRKNIETITPEFIEKGQFSKEIISNTIKRVIARSSKK